MVIVLISVRGMISGSNVCHRNINLIEYSEYALKIGADVHGLGVYESCGSLEDMMNVNAGQAGVDKRV